MTDSSNPHRFADIQLSEQESQALNTLLVSFRARDQFRKQVREIKHIRNMRKDAPLMSGLTQDKFDAQKWLDMVETSELAGALEPSFRFLMRVFVIEQVHDQRYMDGSYDEDLVDISAKIDAIHQREGLEEGTTWTIGNGPADWEELNNRYDGILDKKFEETLREYGLIDIADLYRDDRESYYAKREEGRLLAFSGKSELEELSAIQLKFETEAHACVRNNAYHAAATMIGSAMEAALLFACLNRQDVAQAARSLIPANKRPKSANPKEWTFAQLAKVADEAGWLPNVAVADVVLSSRHLIDMVRRIRNMVHPGRHLSDTVVLDIESQYASVHATYVLLKRVLLATSAD